MIPLSDSERAQLRARFGDSFVAVDDPAFYAAFHADALIEALVDALTAPLDVIRSDGYKAIEGSAQRVDASALTLPGDVPVESRTSPPGMTPRTTNQPKGVDGEIAYTERSDERV